MPRVAALAAVIASLIGASAAHADVNLASADAFSNSVGVNTHVLNGQSPYGDWSRVLGALAELGVRHVRDGVYGNPASSWLDNYFQTRVEQAAAQGIRFDFIMGVPGWDGGTVGQLASVLSGPLRGAVEAVEDPNEYDTSGVADWASQLRAYDQQVYEAVKASPGLGSVPVLGPAIVGDAAVGQLGDQRQWLDVGNIHPYTGGDSPTPAHTASQLERVSTTSGSKPVWATEVGYYNALNAAGYLRPVSESVAAVYLLREFLEDFKSGIARTYAYELIDDNPNPGGTDPQQHFGLLNNDFSPKPAFIALKNLLSLVGQQSPPALSSLPVTITGAPSDMRQLVLQQSPHNYLLMLWRTANIWNPAARKPINLTPARINLNLPTATTASQADPILTNTPTPLNLTNNQTHTQIGADPLIIQITTNTNSTSHPANTTTKPAITSAAATGSFAVVAPSGSVVPVKTSSLRGLPVFTSKAGTPAASATHSSSSAAQTRRGRAAAACGPSASAVRGLAPRFRPVLRWVTKRLRAQPCSRGVTAAKLALFTIRRAGRHGRAQVRLLGARLVRARDPRATCRWVVAQAKRHRHSMVLIRLLPVGSGTGGRGH